MGLVAWAVLAMPEATRFRAPGAATFDAATPGRYVLWHEHRTVFENRTWNRDAKLPDGARIRIVAPSGAELALEKSSGATWKDGSSERVSIGTFDVRETGRHAVTVDGEMEPAVLSVAREFLLQMMGAIIGAVLVAVLGVGGGMALALYTFAQRLQASPASVPHVPHVPHAPHAPHAPAFASAPAFAQAPQPDAEKPLRELTTVVYALQAASLVVGVTLIAAVVINYLKRQEVAGTWLESHFTWQIRTFWWTFAWGAIGFVTAFILIGFFILFGAAIWFIYRVAKGWIALSERRAVG